MAEETKQEEKPLKTFEISFGHRVGKCVVGPYKDVLVEATSYEEAKKKAARMMANKYNAWVFY